MPQVFQVLKCYKCLVFQVHQTKKSNKFECKMCGEKQSIKRHYAIGNGQECRKHVQKLNLIRGDIDESKPTSNDSSEDDNKEKPSKPAVSTSQKTKHSKWSSFIATEEVIDSPDCGNDTMYMNDTEVVLELPKKRQKTISHFGKNRNYIKRVSNISDTEQVNDDYKIGTHINNTSQLTTDKHCINRQTSSTINANNQNDHSNLETSVAIKQESLILNDNPLPSNNSKWSLFGVEVANNTLGLKQDLQSRCFGNENKKKYVPPPPNKNSKWSKFAEEDEDASELPDVNEETVIGLNDEDTQIESNEPNSGKNGISDLHGGEISKINNPSKLFSHNPNNNPLALFSLCDDNDLDEYLTI